jgi:adenylate kinase family enzyme
MQSQSEQPPTPPSLQRLLVVGTTGSGKTTMASRLAQKLDLPHTELDALNWGPDWTMRPNEEFRALVDQASNQDRWVIDGNYSRARDITWPRADTIVWLDYSLPRVLWRLWWRTMDRTLTRKELWAGNRERLYTHFFTRDSLFLWALKTYKRRRREYPELLSRPEHSHITLFRFHSPSQADQWLAAL